MTNFLEPSSETEDGRPVLWTMRQHEPKGRYLSDAEAIAFIGQRFCIYARVSTQHQGKDGDGVQSQLAICRSYAAKQGGLVTREFKEVRSGANPSINLLELLIIECGRSRGKLLVKSVDRVARQAERRVKIMEILRRNAVDIVYVTQLDPESQHMYEFFAEHERHVIRRRVSDAMNNRRAQQRWSYKDATRKSKLFSAESVMLANEARKRKLVGERIEIQHHVLGWHRQRKSIGEIVVLAKQQFPQIKCIGRDRVRSIIKTGLLDPFEAENTQITHEEEKKRAQAIKVLQKKIDKKEKTVTRGRIAKAGRWMATGAGQMSKTESVFTLTEEEKTDMREAYTGWCRWLANYVLVPNNIPGPETLLKYVCRVKDLTQMDLERALADVPPEERLARTPEHLRPQTMN